MEMEMEMEMEGKKRGRRARRRPGCKRLALTLSVVICFVIGVPIWLKSTEVYRTHLPYEAIGSLSTNPLPLLPCHLNVILIPFNSQTQTEDDFALNRYLERLTTSISQLLNENCVVTLTLDSKDKCLRAGISQHSSFSYWPCGLSTYLSSLDISSDDNVVDDLLHSYSRRASGDLDSTGGIYTILATGNISNGNADSHRCVIGKHRHAWIVGEVSESVIVPLIGEIMVNYFIKGGSVHHKGEGVSTPLAADGSATLSFSLLNADPADWIYQWDFEKLEKRFLSPLVEMLAPIANLGVESQVLYHTPKAAHSYWDEQLASYVFHVKDLPFFVNSNEWHLDTSVAATGRSKILQFAIYIPSALECPLRLKLPNGKLSATNGFTSPGWGGIIILNPLTCVSSTMTGNHQRHEFSQEEFGSVMQVVVGQIRMLLGLPPTTLHHTKMHIFSVVASQTGFSDWELDFLLRRRVVEDVASCLLTLASLSRLVESLPSMVIMDEIGDQNLLVKQGLGQRRLFSSHPLCHFCISLLSTTLLSTLLSSFLFCCTHSLQQQRRPYAIEGHGKSLSNQMCESMFLNVSFILFQVKPIFLLHISSRNE